MTEPIELNEWMDKVEEQRQILFPTHSLKTPGQLATSIRTHAWSLHSALHGKRKRPVEYYLRVIIAVALIWLEKIYYERQ